MPPPALALLLLASAGNTHASDVGSCLPAESRLERSLLQTALLELRRAAVGGIVVARGSWGTHMVMTEIFRILTAEYLGHTVRIESTSGTAGSYALLDSGSHDVNIELWESAAPEERETAMVRGTAHDAGRLAYAPYSRSGVYIRPSAVRITGPNLPLNSCHVSSLCGRSTLITAGRPRDRSKPRPLLLSSREHHRTALAVDHFHARQLRPHGRDRAMRRHH